MNLFVIEHAIYHFFKKHYDLKDLVLAVKHLASF